MKVKPHMSMKDNIWFSLNKEHDVNLKEEHLQTIDNLYHQLKLELIKKVGLYRFLNFVLTIPIVVLWFFFNDNQYFQKSLTAVFFCFCLINFIGGIATYISYRNFKKKNNV